jgi:GxxExxY protein
MKPQRTQRQNKKFPFKRLTNNIISCAIEVQTALGPGLLENIYESALAYEFRLRNITFVRQKEVDLVYKNYLVGKHRIDLIIEEKVLLELKAIDKVHPIHEAQILTYLRATGINVGLLLNFNSIRIIDGLKRFVI